MYLGNSDMELLRLAAWCKNLPSDMAGSFHTRVLDPASIWLLDQAGLAMVTKNGRSIRLREKGWRFLQHLGVGYHKDNSYRSGYGRRIEGARILLTFWRAGYEVFASTLGDLEGQRAFALSMAARRDAARGGDIWGGAGFWGLGRIRDTIAACYHVTGHENTALSYRSEKAMLDKAAAILRTSGAMIFAGSGYEKLARAIGNTTPAGTSGKSGRRTFAEIYRNAATPVYLLECSDTGALQLRIMAQEDYRKRLADVVLQYYSPPPVGVTAADGLLWMRDEESLPWLLAVDMDVCRIDRTYRQAVGAGYKGIVLVCLPPQEKPLHMIYGDKRMKFVVITREDLLGAFGTLRLHEPPLGPYLDEKGGMIDAAHLPVD